MMPESAAREEILRQVRASLGREAGRGGVTPPLHTPPLPAVPSTARIPQRASGDVGSEIDLLLSEIAALAGHTRRLAGPAALAAALAELVEAEKITRAAMWQTPELRSFGLAEALASLGVEVAPPGASPAQIATCDLGITGVDAALPETGTLLLLSGPDRPRTVSLLPPVHLALLTPEALRSGLAVALGEFQGASCITLITGPSRTSDIELTLTIGVHGPKALYVWVL
jgi:L-lactate dehydrogenase complex protein LldG